MDSQDAARALLSAPDTRPVGNAPVRVSTSEVQRLWRTRLANTRITGRNMQGVDALLERLRALRPDEEVEQYGFASKALTGNLFFDLRSGAFLGSVIVNTSADAVTSRC